MRKILPVVLLLCFCAFMKISVYAEDVVFIIEEIKEDGSLHLLDETSDYASALQIYEDHVDLVHNIQIRDQNKVWKMNYGVVAFVSSDTCDYNVSFQQGNQNGYTNGCYGADGAYLETSDTNSDRMSFLLSGARGSVQRDDVSLYPIETSTQVSNYHVMDSKLYHRSDAPPLA